MRIVQLVLILLFGALAQTIFAQKSNSIVVFDSLLKNNLLEDALILAEKLEADLPKSAAYLGQMDKALDIAIISKDFYWGSFILVNG
jgi:hypothetical protein